VPYEEVSQFFVDILGSVDGITQELYFAVDFEASELVADLSAPDYDAELTPSDVEVDFEQDL